jgi:hypothetical protein
VSESAAKGPLVAGTLASLSTFLVGFLARPIGRKRLLVDPNEEQGAELARVAGPPPIVC